MGTVLTLLRKGRCFFNHGICFIYGLLLPLSFAPFHLPGCAVISLAFFYHHLRALTPSSAFRAGLWYGLGFFGLGVSWVFVSIHDYGHLTVFLSAAITLLFLVYLALYPACMAMAFKTINPASNHVIYLGLFAALWVIFEWLRATLLTGFPWLLLGFGQIDAPFHTLLPWIGVYGVSFMTAFTAALLAISMRSDATRRRLTALAVIALLLTPGLIADFSKAPVGAKPLSVAVIQANLSMRDKWDETFFWKLLAHYQDAINALLGTGLIVMPESALPVPAAYLNETLLALHEKTYRAGSALLLGIPETVAFDESRYYNRLMALGRGKGNYSKRHLVPFGEYIPTAFNGIMHALNIPDGNLLPGSSHQKTVRVHGIPIASLICYELAYGALLREQLPYAQLIVSISDDGWFGHSLAVYQQLQMAQVRSLQTARYQIVANNDGLSSVIDDKGNILQSLPAFQAGILRTSITPLTSTTPWVRTGDWPALGFAFSISACLLASRLRKTRSLLLPEPRDAILSSLFE